ncbi:hypothetical protein [Catenulispora sp. GAS73]|uniref:hypothetical protein n=1 Tax=Catenulispora sp. GAS73 TaxID=3156269 RepID=UPI0035138228
MPPTALSSATRAPWMFAGGIEPMMIGGDTPPADAGDEADGDVFDEEDVDVSLGDVEADGVPVPDIDVGELVEDP